MTSTKNNSVSANLTLVLGANGKTGRRIVSQLTELGQAVRLGSRSALPAFDWHTPAGWREAIKGVSSIYISYHPDLATPGATDAIESLVGLAKEEGVKKLVLLSGRGEEEAQLCEQIVLNSGIPSTVLRCAWFNQNFSEDFMRDLVMSGAIALPTNGVREPFLDVDDIADAAVAALTEAGHDGHNEFIADGVQRALGRPPRSFKDFARKTSLEGLWNS